MKRFLTWGVIILMLLLVSTLAVVPTIAEKVAVQQYSELVEGGALKVGNIDINYFAGEVQLEQLEATQADQSVLSLGNFSANIDLMALLSGHALIQSIELSDFDITVDQNKKRIVIAGYEISLEEPEQQEEEIEPETEAAEPFIQSYGLEDVNFQ